MENLLKTIENEFSESDGWFRIVGADWYADTLRIELSVSLNNDAEQQLWAISCEHVIREEIVSECAGYLYLEGNHPLLIEYKEPEVEVSFSKNQLSYFELLGAVSYACFKHLGEQPINHWLNTNPSEYSICRSEYGILGTFPLSVANELIEALSSKPIRLNFLPQRTPKYWNGKEHTEYPKNLEILIIENSFIIGTGFGAERA